MEIRTLFGVGESFVAPEMEIRTIIVVEESFVPQKCSLGLYLVY